MARHGTARHCTARHGIARHDMAWHDTKQYNTTKTNVHSHLLAVKDTRAGGLFLSSKISNLFFS
jgi:hypothetical protein